MIGEFRASLYDLFGYFVPGVVVLAGLAMAFCLLASNTPAIQLTAFASAPLAVGAAVVSYVLGHLAHAAGNVLPLLRTRPEELFLTDGLSADVTQRAYANVANLTGLEFSNLSPTEAFQLLEAAGRQREIPADREIYVYREGFYRGMVVATALLTPILLAHVWTGDLAVDFGNGIWRGSRGQLFALTVLSAVACLGFFSRMRRFGRYRVHSTVRSWATVSPTTTTRSPQ